jgi:hypothetical protein
LGVGTVNRQQIAAGRRRRGFHRFIAHVSRRQRPIRKILRQIAVVVSAVGGVIPSGVH